MTRGKRNIGHVHTIEIGPRRLLAPSIDFDKDRGIDNESETAR